MAWLVRQRLYQRGTIDSPAEHAHERIWLGQDETEVEEVGAVEVVEEVRRHGR